MTVCRVASSQEIVTKGTATFTDPLWSALQLSGGQFVRLTFGGTSKYLRAFKRAAGTGDIVFVQAGVFTGVGGTAAEGAVEATGALRPRLHAAVGTAAGWFSLLGLLIAVAGAAIQAVNAAQKNPVVALIALGAALQTAGLLVVFARGVLNLSPS